MNEGRPTSHKEGGEWGKHPPLRSPLERHFGFHNFRPGQHEAIQQLLDGRHVLVVMPTGAGKSLIYQLAACLLPGTTLVISPLIALMKDQVDALTRRGIPATAINSTIPSSEQARRLQGVADGAYRLVYIAPERLRHRAFRQALADTRISLLAVDEAHCISQWGHDFRPDYLHIAAARKEIGHPPTAALTATATSQVQDDIVGLLDLLDAERIVTGFNRPNLTFRVRYTPDLSDKLRAPREFLAQNPGPGIIYVGTRREAEEVADFIREVVGREARAYHAGMEDALRTTIQDAFMAGRLNLVVATNAFGMGVDRADVRFVLHFSLPGTLEAYYQEAGRAGRDGRPAECMLLYSPQDRALQEWFIENDAPSAHELEVLYRTVREVAREDVAVLTLDDLALATGIGEVKLRVGLSLLEQMEALHRLGDEGRRLWLEVESWRPERLRVTAAEVEARRAHKRRQLARMVAYAEADTCRRRLILAHFGDKGPAEAPTCCDNCLSTVPPVERAALEALPEESRIALGVLDTVGRLSWSVGREKVAQILKGSRAKDIIARGYDRSPYYGRLADLTLKEIQGLIGQLVDGGLLKVVGGELPVVRLTPQGREALAQRASIPLRLPRKHRPEAVQRRREEREAGGTVAYTGELFAQGMTPSQIAAHRGLKESTIYGHLAQLIAAGVVDVDAVVPREVQERVRTAIRRVGSTQALSPIKALLPDDISYELIGCVVAAWEREQVREGKAAEGEPQVTLPPEQRWRRIVAMGESGDPSHVPELIAALQDRDGNVRRLAASALGKIGDPRAVEPLLTLLASESNPQVRPYAIKALGKIGDPRARADLERISSDPQERDYNVKAARIALANLRKEEPDEVSAFLARSHPRPLTGPWQSGWALDFHSRFAGSDRHLTAMGNLAHRFKYRGERGLVGILAERLHAFIQDHPELARVDAILPVPASTPRPSDPVRALAEALGQRLGVPVRADWLVKTRTTRPQKEMRTRAQKQANVKGAFAVRSSVRGLRLLVLDDLYDSGETLKEVTRVLKQAEATAVMVLTPTRTIHSDT